MQEMQQTQIRSLGQEDPLQKEMATHSSVLAREIPWTEEPGGLQFMGLQKEQNATKQLDLSTCCAPPGISFLACFIWKIPLVPTEIALLWVS